MEANPDLESLCKHCGVCCLGKIRVNDVMVAFRGSPCEFLVKASGKGWNCQVYKERFDVKKDCVTLDKAIQLGLLPADCGYKEMFPQGYKPCIVVDSLKDIKADWLWK